VRLPVWGKVLQKKLALERGPRLKRLEPTLPQPFRLLVLVCKVPDKLWGKLVLVALRLRNKPVQGHKLP
jgi:hypothetical protein